MQRHLITASALALAVAAFAAGTAVAQTKSATAQKAPSMADLDCRTLLRLDGEERAFTLLYYHGFVSGRLNQTELPVDVMAAATDRIIDLCIDKPGDKVLAVFERVCKPE